MQFIHTAISAAAVGCGGRLAVWSNAGSMTYAELHARSSGLAAWLRERGAAPGARVCVAMRRTADAVAGILGALKAGAAYVPVEPSWPPARQRDVVRRCAPAAILCDGDAAAWCGGRVPVLRAGTARWRAAERRAGPRAGGVSASDPAYILFTSGSTGEPKGVCISHRAANYFAAWAAKRFGLSAGDRIAAVAPFTFDLSTFDLFAGLRAGAEVHLAGERCRLLPTELSRFLESHAATVFYTVPTTLMFLERRGLLERRDLSALRLVLFAGEPYPPQLLRSVMLKVPSRVRWFNLYGPTETNVCTCYALRCPPAGRAPVPIGKALPGTRVFVPGRGGGRRARQGELCVIGPGVMSGYWGQAAGAGDCWADPPGGARRAGDGEPARMRAYRTGDIARRRPDGNWVFLGRGDRMVKVCGYRVEPAEVEARLCEHASVKSAAVVRAERAEPGGQLAAFVVPARGCGGAAAAALAGELRRFCRARLPHYMVPAAIRFVDALPLTCAGKTDRLKLAAMCGARRADAAAGGRTDG